MKTPITYYGGKQKLVGKILPLIPEHDIYCEPFAGGGAVFFAKPPSKTEIINDNDAMISIFYSVLKNDFNSLKKKIEATIYDRSIFKVASVIRKIPHFFSDLSIAWAFYTLSALGFSGMLDSFGCYTKGTNAQTLINKRALFTKELAHRMEGVQIENTDALKLLKLRDSETSFFYLDPPYVATIQGHYRGYTNQDYLNLLDVLSNLKGQFLLSSFPSDVLETYIKKNGWYSIEVNQVKAASRNPNGTKKRKIEVLTANYYIQ